MTHGDRILGVVIVLIALIATPVVASAFSGGSSRVDITGPEGRTVLDRHTDASVVVEGSSGDVVVTIHDGLVEVTESSCPDQVCVRCRPVGDDGGVIACVPNGVTVTVGGAEEGDLDAVVR